MHTIRQIVFWSIMCAALTGLSAEEKLGCLAWAGTNTVDLGEYPCTEDKTARHKITNTGTAPLHIDRVIITCSCMRLDSFPPVLAPGETGEVVVTIKKYGVFEKYQRIFFIESADSSNPRLRGTITGISFPLFSVTCDKEPFMKGAVQGTVWTGRYSVVSMQDGLTLAAPIIQCRGMRCQYTIQTNTQARIRYEVTLVATVLNPNDAFESAMLFPVLNKAGEKEPLQPIRVSVKGGQHMLFSAVPGTLLIPRTGKPIVRRMVLSAMSATVADLTQFSWDTELDGVTVASRSSGLSIVVEATFPTNTVERLFNKGPSTITFKSGELGYKVPVLPAK